MKFKKFQDKIIPEDIELIVPENSDSNTLAYIPWQEKYLEYVPEEWKEFFKVALPHLGVRTTDVHTAICTSFIDKIIKLNGGEVNRRVVALGLILHDSGWSGVPEQDIMDSLSEYKSLELSKVATRVREGHANAGAEIAEKLISDFNFNPPLSDKDKEAIVKAVLNHDDPASGPIEEKLVADLDRLWSFTHENFWQDTIRKDVSPEQYLDNLTKDSETYFYTKAGLTIAGELLQDRSKEIEQIK